MDDGVLPKTLQESGFGTRGRTLGKACVEGHLGARVAQKQVFNDLLDTPLIGA